MQGCAGAGRRDRLAAIIGNAQAQQRMTQVQRRLAQSGEIQLAAVEFHAYRWAAMPPRGETDCRPTQ